MMSATALLRYTRNQAVWGLCGSGLTPLQGRYAGRLFYLGAKLCKTKTDTNRIDV